MSFWGCMWHGGTQCSDIYMLSGTFLEGTNLCGDILSQFLCILSLLGHGSHLGLSTLGEDNPALPNPEWKYPPLFLPRETHEQQHTNSSFSKSEFLGNIRFRILGGHRFRFPTGFARSSSRPDQYPLKSWGTYNVQSVLLFSRAVTYSNLCLFSIDHCWQPSSPNGVCVILSSGEHICFKVGTVKAINLF